ncbi:hypothetical protein KHQ81_10730 [Mycoplasmatota bacterium]|nr:hypothetical protein KHQ81_10730 [Mycoplasmatota bacterium]
MSDKKVLGKSLEDLFKENRYDNIRGFNFKSPLFLIHKEIMGNKEKTVKTLDGKI